MSRSYLIHRNLSFQRQNGRCHYCNAPMWLGHPGNFADRYRLKGDEVKRFQCTAEHLLAQQDGGKNASTNIVAACFFCNWTRHARPRPLSTEAYAVYVKKRVMKSKWHPERLRHLLVD